MTIRKAGVCADGFRDAASRVVRNEAAVTSGPDLPFEQALHAAAQLPESRPPKLALTLGRFIGHTK
jgi:hypothetical protein